MGCVGGVGGWGSSWDLGRGQAKKKKKKHRGGGGHQKQKEEKSDIQTLATMDPNPKTKELHANIIQ